MSRRTQMWSLILVSALLSQALIGRLSYGVWIITVETLVRAVVTAVLQVVALELARRFIWKDAW